MMLLNKLRPSRPSPALKDSIVPTFHGPIIRLSFVHLELYGPTMSTPALTRILSQFIQVRHYTRSRTQSVLSMMSTPYLLLDQRIGFPYPQRTLRCGRSSHCRPRTGHNVSDTMVCQESQVTVTSLKDATEARSHIYIVVAAALCITRWGASLLIFGGQTYSHRCRAALVRQMI